MGKITSQQTAVTTPVPKKAMYVGLVCSSKSLGELFIKEKVRLCPNSMQHHFQRYTYRCHGFSSVVRNDSLEKWDGSLYFLLGEESQNTNLGQSSIVEFLNETVRLLFLGLVLGKAKGVKEVQWDRVRNPILFGELWECARLASTHVVLFASGLRPPFQKSNKENDL